MRPPRRSSTQARRSPRPGVILAGTFASLMLGGNALSVSMGFALSFGILIAAFVMAMFFTPALTALHRARRLVAGPRRREGPEGPRPAGAGVDQGRLARLEVPQATSYDPRSPGERQDDVRGVLDQDRGDREAGVGGQVEGGRRTTPRDHLGAERGDHRPVVGAQPRAGTRTRMPSGDGALLGQTAQARVGGDAATDEQVLHALGRGRVQGLADQDVAHRLLERRRDVGDRHRLAGALAGLHPARDGRLQPGEREVEPVPLPGRVAG